MLALEERDQLSPHHHARRSAAASSVALSHQQPSPDAPVPEQQQQHPSSSNSSSWVGLAAELSEPSSAGAGRDGVPLQVSPGPGMLAQDLGHQMRARFQSTAGVRNLPRSTHGIHDAHRRASRASNVWEGLPSNADELPLSRLGSLNAVAEGLTPTKVRPVSSSLEAALQLNRLRQQQQQQPQPQSPQQQQSPHHHQQQQQEQEQWEGERVLPDPHVQSLLEQQRHQIRELQQKLQQQQQQQHHQQQLPAPHSPTHVFALLPPAGHPPSDALEHHAHEHHQEQLSKHQLYLHHHHHEQQQPQPCQLQPLQHHELLDVLSKHPEIMEQAPNQHALALVRSLYQQQLHHTAHPPEQQQPLHKAPTGAHAQEQLQQELPLLALQEGQPAQPSSAPTYILPILFLPAPPAHANAHVALQPPDNPTRAPQLLLPGAQPQGECFCLAFSLATVTSGFNMLPLCDSLHSGQA